MADPAGSKHELLGANDVELLTCINTNEHKHTDGITSTKGQTSALALEAHLNYSLEAQKCGIGTLNKGILVTIGGGPVGVAGRMVSHIGFLICVFGIFGVFFAVFFPIRSDSTNLTISNIVSQGIARAIF